MTHGALRALLVLTLAAGLACRPEEEPLRPPGPEDVALRLFETARLPDPTAEQLAGLFEPQPDEKRRAQLYDALTRLAVTGSPRIDLVVPLEALGRTAVDLSVSLPGGGVARYSVQVEEAAAGAFRVLWFQGPGVEWPSRSRGRGEGLTTSPASPGAERGVR